MASDVPIDLQNDPILILTPINLPGIHHNTSSSLWGHESHQEATGESRIPIRIVLEGWDEIPGFLQEGGGWLGSA